MTIKRFITNLLALFTLFTVSLACKDTEKSIINSSFSISEEYLIQNLDKSSTSVQIPINTSMELAQWSVSYEANWLQCSKQKTAAEGTFLRITVNENTGETKRTANIKVTSTTATYTITVNQYAKGEVIVEGDIKVTPTGGKASEHQEGQDIENTCDGKFSTDGAAPFHTPWGQSAKFPVTLEYYFKGDTEIDYLIYYTRSGNGNFGKVKVYTTTNPDRSDYTLQGEYDFKEQNAPSKVSFSEGIKAERKSNPKIYFLQRAKNPLVEFLPIGMKETVVFHTRFLQKSTCGKQRENLSFQQKETALSVIAARCHLSQRARLCCLYLRSAIGSPFGGAGKAVRL